MNKDGKSVIKRLVNVNDKVLTVEEVAEKMGISPWGVRKQIQRGFLPAHKHGRRYYILNSELNETIREKNTPYN